LTKHHFPAVLRHDGLLALPFVVVAKVRGKCKLKKLVSGLTIGHSWVRARSLGVLQVTTSMIFWPVHRVETGAKCPNVRPDTSKMSECQT
jgi:hypothetical protein